MEIKEKAAILKRIESILGGGFENSAKGKNAEEIVSDLSIYYQELVVQNEEMDRIMLENELIKRSYRELYEDAPAGYVVYNNNGVIVTANNTFCRILGLKLLEKQEQKLTWYVLPNYQDELYLMMQRVLKTGEAESIEIQLKGGEEVRDVMIITNCFGTPGALFECGKEVEGSLLRSVITDITDLKRRQREVWNRSVRDPLTGIYNRQFYNEKMQDLDTPHNLPLSVAMLDIDGLKIINDTLGHCFGDEAIKCVADELSRNADPRYTLTRVGGDEIIILFPKTELEEARRYMQKVKSLVSNKSLSGIPLSFSWGAATKYSSDEKFPYVLAAAEDMMYSRKLARGGGHRNGTVYMILESLCLRNREIKEHSGRVGLILQEFGKWMGVDREKLKFLESLGTLHDIGLASIEEGILNKDEPLTEEEGKEFLRHPEVGSRILHANADTADFAEIVLHHHENWDGTGYPSGLSGEAIPYESRILAIADAYDRMRYGLNGKGTMYNSEAKILEKLNQCAGHQFDPKLTEDFLRWKGFKGE